MNSSTETITTMDKLPLRKGNLAFRAGNFVGAISDYLHALKQSTAHIKSITFNVELAKKRLLETSDQPEKHSVLLIAGDLTVIDGRMLNLATLYDGPAQPRLVIGANARHASELATHRSNHPGHLYVSINEQDNFPYGILDFVAANPCEIIHLCNPAPFNVALGLLHKAVWGSKVIVDFGFENTASTQFNNTGDIWLQFLNACGHFINTVDSKNNPLVLQKELSAIFDGFTVASPLARETFGGELVRISHPEFPLLPSAATRQQLRQNLGIHDSHKVLLCIGDISPRQTALDLANAITRIDIPDLLLAVSGDTQNTASISILQGMLKTKVLVLKTGQRSTHNHPFAVADACLLSPTEQLGALNQFLFDLADVMALRIPALTTATITHFPEATAMGAVSLVTNSMLSRKLREFFSDNEATRKQRYAVESYFLAELSRPSNQTRLINCCRKAGAHPQRFDPLLRNLFALAGISSAYVSFSLPDINEYPPADEANPVVGFDLTRPRKSFAYNPATTFSNVLSGCSLLSLFGLPIGYCPKSAQTATHNRIFLSLIGLFLKLSGCDPKAELLANSGQKSDLDLWQDPPVIGSLPTPLSLPGVAAIADLWFCSRNVLRCKVDVYAQPAAGTGFFVLQFFQIKCKDGTLFRCAEHVVAADSLGIIDIPLINQYMPILVTAHDSSGLLHATNVLAFPSLARGGCHAGEVAFHPQWSISNTQFADSSTALTEKWLQTLSGTPMVRGMQIDARGANGSERIFSANFLTWIKTVFRVDVQLQSAGTITPFESEGLDHLAMTINSSASTLNNGNPARTAGSWLRQPPHAIPTLQALTASEDATIDFRLAGSTYLIADPMTCEATRLISIPGSCDLLDQLQASFSAPDYPVLQSDGTSTNAAAIALQSPPVATPLTINFPCEPHPTAPCLLMPVAMDYHEPIFANVRDTSLAPKHSPLIVVLRLQSTPQALDTFLACLGQQWHMSRIDIVAVMTTSFDGDDETASSLLERHFPSRHRLMRRVDLAASRKSPLSIPGKSGSFVLLATDSLSLHDNRTLSVLCHIASHAEVGAASCQLIKQITTSKEVDFKLAASGQCPVYNGPSASAPTLQAIEDHGLFAGMTYPVATTNRAITIFAADTLKHLGLNLLGAADDSQTFRNLCQTAENKGYINVCTGIVTATENSLPDKDDSVTLFHRDEKSHSARISTIQLRTLMPA